MKRVKIIVADIRGHQTDADRILSRIAPCYAKKYRRHKMQQDIDQALVTGDLLRKYLGIRRDEQLVYNHAGKPFLASGGKYFSISHSGDYVALAIADCDVGIDIEKTRSYHEVVVKKVFDIKQQAELLTKEGAERDQDFTRIWTECEAVLKLKGVGFAQGWEQAKGGGLAAAVHTTIIEDYFLTVATQQTSNYTIYKINQHGGKELWQEQK